jgi:hypothetical protein
MSRSPHKKTETDPVCETLFSGHLKFRTINKVQKADDSVIRHSENPLDSPVLTPLCTALRKKRQTVFTLNVGGNMKIVLFVGAVITIPFIQALSIKFRDRISVKTPLECLFSELPQHFLRRDIELISKLYGQRLYITLIGLIKFVLIRGTNLR